MSVGLNIKRRRFELNMSQQELANAMGYKSRSTIAKIESGENDVSQKKLQKFATVLDTTVEALVSGYTIFPASHSADPTILKPKKHKNVAIVLAGGKTGRNHLNIPSQFVNSRGKPIIMYCMSAYQNHPSIDDIYVVCLKGWEDIVQDYAFQYNITKLKAILPAGNSGITSLKAGIDYIRNLYDDNDIIIIQESTRPMVNEEMISKLLLSCSEHGSATICHYMNDYVQFNISGETPTYINRNDIISLESPEAHRLSLIKEVFDKATQLQHPLSESCCTMLLYNLGYKINFIEGNMNNIKITREEDLAAFNALSKDTI